MTIIIVFSFCWEYRQSLFSIIVFEASCVWVAKEDSVSWIP